jgi:hypothetical protein
MSGVWARGSLPHLGGEDRDEQENRMSSTTKHDLLRANVVQAIDAIVNDTELDDATKENLFEEIEEYLQDKQRILSDEDDEDEDDEDEDD